MLRQATVIALLWLTVLCAGAKSVTDSIISRLRCMPLHAVEGLWSLPGHDAMVVIERDSVTSAGQVLSYSIKVASCADRSIRCGTVIGRLTPTSRSDTFDARIFSDITSGKKRRLTGSRRCTITLAEDDSRLRIEPYGRRIKLRWWRLLPYMLRWSITETEAKAPAGDGFVRVFPEGKPVNPVYL